MATNNALNNRSTSGFSVTGGVVSLPTTTSTVGQITVNGSPFLHDYNNNVCLGNTTGNFTATGTNNCFIGNNVAESTWTTASNNIGIGNSALNWAGTGTYNVAIGTQSMTGNAGAGIGGSYNIAIGYQSGDNLYNSESSNICLNNPGNTSVSNALYIGNGTGTGNQQLNSAYISGIYGKTGGASAQAVIIGSDDQLGTVAKSAVGSMVLIETKTANASSALNFTSGITSTYKNYFVVVNNITRSGSGTVFNMRISTNGGSTYISTGYLTAGGAQNLSTGAVSNGATTTNFWNLAYSDTYGSSASVYLYNLTNGSYPSSTGNGVSYIGGVGYGQNWSSLYPTTATVNALSFFITGDTMASGTISLYGIVS